MRTDLRRRRRRRRRTRRTRRKLTKNLPILSYNSEQGALCECVAESNNQRLAANVRAPDVATRGWERDKGDRKEETERKTTERRK
jgi:hypothetical protein